MTINNSNSIIIRMTKEGAGSDEKTAGYYLGFCLATIKELFNQKALYKSDFDQKKNDYLLSGLAKRHWFILKKELRLSKLTTKSVRINIL